jgi:hypothetical protein
MSGTFGTKSTNAKAYWIGASGGDWGTAANSKDTTTNAPATVPVRHNAAMRTPAGVASFHP